MAISITSGNLNMLGNAGNFETDPSTWGFGGGTLFQITRSTLHSSKDSSSCKCLVLDEGDGFGTVSSYCKARFAAAVGKRYFIKAKIYTTEALKPSNAPGTDFYLESLGPSLTILDQVNQPVDDFVGVWQQLELYVEAVSNSLSSINVRGGGADHAQLPGRAVFTDEFEIYEYIDVVEPCTLEIDVAGTVVTNETVLGAHDGSIAVAITGGTGPFEYSKDGGATWQPSHLFAGLAPAVYSVVVRETTTFSCNSTQSFAVNAAAYGFSFTVDKTDETLIGAGDGSIAVTVVGAVAPFSFSKDGGVTYQDSNVFDDLAPGTYTIVVKDHGGIMRASNVTILAGTSLFNKIWHSKNPIILSLNASPGWEAEANYKLYDDIRVEEVTGSGIFTSALITALTPFSDGTVTFQVSEAFRDVLKAVVDLTADFVRLTDRVKFFKHYTGEISGTSDVPGALTASFPNLVIMGGISKAKFPDMNFFGTLSVTKKFFSWAPVTKLVDGNQPDFLTYFVFGTAVNTLKLQVKAYYDDGTNATAITLTQEGAVYGHLYQLPSGPVTSGASLINGAKNLVQYEICLLDQDDTVISEIRAYVIAAISHPLKRYFLFLNSLGGFEVLTFTGAALHQTEVVKDEVTKYLPYNYSAVDGEIEVNNASSRDATSFSSGYALQKDWQNYLKDLLLSKRVYLLDDGSPKPIIVSGGTYALDEDHNYERFIRFVAKDAFNEESYTP